MTRTDQRSARVRSPLSQRVDGHPVNEATAPFAELGIRGLTSVDVAARRSRGGRNTVRTVQPWSLRRQIRQSLTQPLVLLLLVVAVLYVVLGEPRDLVRPAIGLAEDTA